MTIAAAMMNEQGDILAYTAQSTMSQCEEFCRQFFLDYDKLISIGCRIVQVEIKVI